MRLRLVAMTDLLSVADGVGDRDIQTRMRRRIEVPDCLAEKRRLPVPRLRTPSPVEDIFGRQTDGPLAVAPAGREHVETAAVNDDVRVSGQIAHRIAPRRKYIE